MRKILRLLYHVVAHIYHCHFREVALLGLHAHLNCVFAHLTLLNQRFNLIDPKETEILGDLEAALLGKLLYAIVVLPSRRCGIDRCRLRNTGERSQAELPVFLSGEILPSASFKERLFFIDLRFPRRNKSSWFSLVRFLPEFLF